jgi:Protein NO VEIN, C-terminal
MARRGRTARMADEEKTGKTWSDEELDAIVADYFTMLDAEIKGRSYVKAHHSAALMKQIGRTHRSVEFKHQNISAVLEELGAHWIHGYKPKRNYQGAIFGAIDRYLSAHGDVLLRPVRPTAPNPTEEGLFVEAPTLGARMDRPRQLDRLVRKFDPALRDYRNRALGRAGEEFVLKAERQRLAGAKRYDLAEQVRWIAAEEGDGAGYDIYSFTPSGNDRLIEVKTTNGTALTPFFLTRNEMETAEGQAESWRLYRVHQFSRSPRIFTLKPPLHASVYLRTETWIASFGA